MKPPDISRQKLAVVLVATLLVAAGGVAAYTTIFNVGSGTSYETGSGLIVETNTDHGLDGSNPFVDTETVYIDGVSFSASGSGSLSVDQFRGTRTSVSSVDASSTTITVDPDDKSAVEISGGVTALSWEDAALDGTAQITYSASSSGTITVTGLAANTTYAAATTTGEVLETGSTTASGEATITVDAATDEDVVLLEPSTATFGAGSPSSQSFNDENIQVSIAVNDTDFGTDAGDDVQVDLFVDGSQIDTKTVTSNQTVVFNVSDLADGSHSWHVETIDSYGETSSSSTFDFEVNHYAPVPDNAAADPQDSAKKTTKMVEFTLPVNDTDFAETSGDDVQVEFYLDGSKFATKNLTANGTVSASTTISVGGSHTWHAEFVDEYGLTSETDADANTTGYQAFSFYSPSELKVYNESSPDELVDNATVNIRFYGGADGDGFTVQRETTNGVVNMSGLPVDQEFVVVAKADGYHNRRIYVESLYDQANVFLLPETSTSVYNVFKVDDKSGSYPPGETRLSIQRALNRSGNFTWYTISGDFFGSTNEHKTYLKYNVRYRLIVENDAGERRMMGPYMATDEDNPKVISISSIIVDPPEGQPYYGTGWVSREDPAPNNNVTERTLRFSYSDSANLTESLHLVIHEQGNESNELAEIDVDNVGESWAYTYTLEGENATDTAWVIDWSGKRGDGDGGVNEIGATFPVGQRGGLPIPMDPDWLARFALVALPIIAALASERIATYGAMGTTAFAGVLMITGIWEIPVALWFAALVISVGGHAFTMSSRGSVFG